MTNDKVVSAALLAPLLWRLALGNRAQIELTFCLSVIRGGRKALGTGGPARESLWATQAQCPGETPGATRETEKHRRGRHDKTFFTSLKSLLSPLNGCIGVPQCNAMSTATACCACVSSSSSSSLCLLVDCKLILNYIEVCRCRACLFCSVYRL